MFFDTHAHVNFNAFKEDAEEVMRRAFENGVSVVNVGTQLDTSRQAVDFARKFSGEGLGTPRAYAVVGLHPVHTYSQHLDEEETSFRTREDEFDYEAYKTLAQSPEVVGIGECGLDYYRLPEGSDAELARENQKRAFEKQMKLAAELGKSLVIHTRSSPGTDDACLDVLQMVKDVFLPAGGKNFVLHSYTGSSEVAKKFVEIGAYISFNGILTFDKTGNQVSVLQVVPSEKILLETDCPYLTPVPVRGKRNEPSFVRHVAEKVAEVKGLSVDEVGEITSQNAKNLFQLN